MLFSPLLAIALSFGFIYFLWTRRKLFRLIFHLPSPVGLPLFGSEIDFFNSTCKLDLKFSDTHLIPYIIYLYAVPNFQKTQCFYVNGSTSLFCVALQAFLFTRDPEVTKDILTSSQCHNRPELFTKEMKEFHELGLLTLKGARKFN